MTPITLTPDEQHFADQDDESMALWFLDLGVSVFPTVNKHPAIAKGTSWKDYHCTRAQALRFVEYAVPLGFFAVVDSDSGQTEAWVATHLPETPFMVTTGRYHDGSRGRGRHRYYRLAGDAPHFIHRDGLTIEFKHRGQYVVGPGSRRPDGVVYLPAVWSWLVDDVPHFPIADFCFDDGSCGRFSVTGSGEPYEFPDVVRAGERHDQLFRLLRSCKGKGWDRETTRETVTLANENRCDPPLAEDDTFERWFTRQWDKPDRPFTPPLRGLTGLRGL